MEKLKKIADNKVLRIIGSIIYTILIILVLLLLVVVAIQRFSNNTISVAGFRIFNVATKSMAPPYEVGDVILSKSVPPEELHPGDDVTYVGREGSFAGRVVTHRIKKIEKTDDGYRITTQGIANVLADPEITDKDVQGKVVYKFKILSLLSKLLSSDLKVVYILIFLPCGIWLFFNIKRTFFDKDDDDDDDDDEKEDEDNDDKEDKEENEDDEEDVEDNKEK